MSEKQGRKPTGRVNYIWVLAAMYLLYVAYQLFSRAWKGEAESLPLNIVGGVVFLAAAVLLVLREWRAYQYGKAHIDDPETWSDDPLEDEEAEAAPALEESPAGEDEERKEEAP